MISGINLIFEQKLFVCNKVISKVSRWNIYLSQNSRSAIVKVIKMNETYIRSIEQFHIDYI